MNLDTSIRNIKGVGEKTEKLLNKIGVYTIRDILLNFPYNFSFFHNPVSIKEITLDETNAIVGKISKPLYLKGGPLKTVLTTITDGNNNLQVMFFNMPYIKNTLHVGDTFVFVGKVSVRNNQLAMIQPKTYQIDEYNSLIDIPQPIYHLTEGLTNKTYTSIVKKVIEASSLFEDYLSDEIKNRRNLVSREDAIRNCHLPNNLDELESGRRRLAFDDFFMFLLRLELTKSQILRTQITMEESIDIDELSSSLEFSLTNDQKTAISDILNDMKSNNPMQRLLQGDVGSGKTIVAFFAILNCVRNGYQAVMMAPTEVLANQHYTKLVSFMKQFSPDTSVYLLTGSVKKSEKKVIKEQLSKIKNSVVIGTHALLEDDVILPNLGLVITDEQHRFGVKQRDTLGNKGDYPHILVMSATPIPRTLAIILYGDLKVSLIKEMPKNRIPIKNCVVSTSYRKKAYEFIENEIKKGHQAYIICPLVEESEGLDAEDVVSYSKMLSDYYENRVKVAMLHGAMKPQEKNEIMDTFAKKEIDVLVSTTVIEVGVDVPNATVMMVENSERFGLAQLHQLRGRIGRGGFESYCIFMSSKKDPQKIERLKILNESNDGFHIAEMDLKLRGPGDVFGIRQSGEISFLMADIYNDSDILQDAAIEAQNIVKEDRDLIMASHQLLKETLAI